MPIDLALVKLHRAMETADFTDENGCSHRNG